MEREEDQNQVSLSSHGPWKSLSRFPHSHSLDHCLIPNERSPRGGSLRSRLQAHSSMRKCYGHLHGGRCASEAAAVESRRPFPARAAYFTSTVAPASTN